MSVGKKDVHKRQTKVVPRSLDPRWDERLLFPGTLAELQVHTCRRQSQRGVASWGVAGELGLERGLGCVLRILTEVADVPAHLVRVRVGVRVGVGARARV